MRSLFLFILLCSCASTSVSTPENSLSEYGFKGLVKRVTTDTLHYSPDSVVRRGELRFNEAGMVLSRGYARSSSYGEKYQVDYRYSYDSEGLLTRLEGPSYTEEYDYDAKGRKLLQLENDMDGDMKRHYSYTRGGLLLKDSCYFQDTRYSYDKAGNCIGKRKHDPRDGTDSTDDMLTRCRYDARGRLVEEWKKSVESSSWDGTLYHYDERGNQLSKEEREGAPVHFGKGSFDYREVREYDSLGGVVHYRLYGTSPLVLTRQWRKRYEYDEQGNWLREYFINAEGKERLIRQRSIAYWE